MKTKNQFFMVLLSVGMSALVAQNAFGKLVEMEESLTSNELRRRVPYYDAVSGGTIKPVYADQALPVMPGSEYVGQTLMNPEIPKGGQQIQPQPMTESPRALLQMIGMNRPFQSDPDKVPNVFEQEYFTYDVERALQKSGDVDFLTYKNKFYSKLDFDPDKSLMHLQPYQYLRSWREQFHPPIKKLTLPLHRYASMMTPIEDRAAENSKFFDVGFQNELDQVSSSEMSFGNKLKLVSNGKAFMEKLRLLREAKRYFYLINMTFLCGPDSRGLAEEMIKRKKEGIDVRVMLEGMYIKTFFHTCYDLLTAGGVPVVLVNDLFKQFKKPSMMHDKFWIRDGEEGIIGGQNILDYNARSDGFTKSDRDSDVLIQGPAVADMLKEYTYLWDLHRKPDQPSAEAMHQEALAQIERERAQGLRGAEFYADRLANPATRMDGNCRVLVQKYHAKHHAIAPVVDAYTRASNKSVIVTSPSVNWTPKLDKPKWADKYAKLLIEKAKEGTEVHVISNGIFARNGDLTNIFEDVQLRIGNPDSIRSRLLQFLDNRASIKRARAQRSLMRTLQAEGVKNYGYTVFMHAKLYSWDRVATMVSSFNIDTYSAENNHETGIVCLDDALADQLDYQLTLDMVNSTPMVSGNGK